MGQILHGSATTTETIRRAIQNSQASLRELAVRHGIGRLEALVVNVRCSSSLMLFTVFDGRFLSFIAV